MRPVLVDTCIWISFFNRPQSAEKKTVDALLDDDRAALIGPVAAEILESKLYINDIDSTSYVLGQNKAVKGQRHQ